MTSKRTVLGWLAALALVATACGGGDAGPAPLAAADVPIVPEVAGDAPPPEEGEIVEEEAPTEEEPAAEGEEAPAAPVVEAEPASQQTYAYADDLERAATTMVVPADIADALPDLRLLAARTGPLDSFAVYRRNAAASEVLAVDPDRHAAAGYEAMFVGLASDEAQERLGSAYPEVRLLAVEVTVYADDATADARLAELRAAYEEIAEVADQPGVAGDGFVVHAEVGGSPSVSVYLAGHGAVGVVVAYGTTSPDPAVAAAQALGVRMWKASEGMLAPRDPLAEATGYQVPAAALDSFEASADVIVSAEGEVLERVRWTGKYQGSNRFSCQQTYYVGGTEELLAEVVADGAEASVFDLETLSSGKYDVFSPEVAAAVADCPVFPAAWQEYFVPEPSMLHAAPASTLAGAGTALRTRDEARLLRASGVGPAAGSELEDFSIFITEDGWASAIHFDVSYPPEVSAELFNIPVRVNVRNSVRVTKIDGVEVPQPLYFGGDDDLFAVGVGDEVVPPADEPVPAEGTDAGASAPADEAGEGGTGGDVQAASGDDGLFGSGSYGSGSGGSGSDEGHFAGTTPVGGAEDVAAQDAVRLTMIGLVAFYLDNGNYLATPGDVAYYAAGVSTTDDPAQAGAYATVFVPGDQETVVWAAGGSVYFCLAAQGTATLLFGSGSTAGEVDSFAECAAGGSPEGW